VKLKILEEIAHAKPVVTNGLGTEGIATRPGLDFILAEDPRAIVKAYNQLPADAALRSRFGNAARVFIVEQLDLLRLQRMLKEEARQKLNLRGILNLRSIAIPPLADFSAWAEQE
jgi:glycosyltransferase involved in cell wall biosynthesis